MFGQLHRLLTFTCFVDRLRRRPFHNSDKQPDLTGPTFAALTPLAALFDVVLAVLTPLGRDFVAQVAPTWAPGPSLTLEKPCFSLGFSYISRNCNFCDKVIQKTSK